MKKNNNIEVLFPNYYVELSLDNGDTLIFSLIYRKDGLFYLEKECSSDDFDMEKHTKDIFKEITILSNKILMLDINDIENSITEKINGIVINDVPNSNDNYLKISGNLCKYSKEVAKLYNLDINYANADVKERILNKIDK